MIYGNDWQYQKSNLENYYKIKKNFFWKCNCLDSLIG